MNRTPNYLLGKLAGLTILVMTPLLLAQQPTAGQQPVYLKLWVPSGAIVEIEGLKTAQTGELRRYQSPAVAVGKNYFYTIKVSWKDAEGKDVVREEVVRVAPGQETPFDFRPAGAAASSSPPIVNGKATPKLDVIFVPTPQDVVDKMLEMANVTKDDVVYDLGCGDGRIVVTAAKKYGAKGVGIDLDPQRVKESIENVKKAGVEDLVEIREGNALQVEDLGKASVVTLYLLPNLNRKLMPQLKKELKPGSRVVSHEFDMGPDWKPTASAKVQDGSGRTRNVHLWLIEGEKKDEAKEDAKKEDAKKEEKKDEPKKEDAKKEELKADPKKEEKKDEPKKEDKKDDAKAKGEEEAKKEEADDKDKKEDRRPDVIFVPTPQEVVDKMLAMAKVKEGDVVYDLGCGDGRIVVTAAKKFKAKGIGYDIDPVRVKESIENVKKNKVEDTVKIEQKDIFTLDLSGANVITLYLLPQLNVKLIPQLDKLKPGSRIVSHDFDMEGVKPDEVVRMKAKNDEGTEREHTIYLWTVPLKKEKK